MIAHQKIEISTLNKQKRQLEETVSQLQKDLSESNERGNKLSAEAVAFKEIQKSLEFRLDEVLVKIKENDSIVDGLQTRITQLESENLLVVQDKDQALEDMKAMRKDVEEMNNKKLHAEKILEHEVWLQTSLKQQLKDKEDIVRRERAEFDKLVKRNGVLEQ